MIAGCGKIGSAVLTNLVAEGHDVIAIDTSDAVIQHLANIYDVMGVCGSCTDSESLQEADVGNAELFFASAGSDELNMLSCFIAKKMGAAHTIARIRNPEYSGDSFAFMKDSLGLSMSVNPDLLAAKELYNILRLPSAANIETFCQDSFEMVELHLKDNSQLDGVRLMDLRDKYKAKFLVGAVQRGEEVYIPDGNFVLKSGDRVGLTASPIEMLRILRSVGVLQKRAKDVMIFGASRIAFYLSKMLLSSGHTVKIIEKDPQMCQFFSDELGGDVILINGDGASQELLQEEGLNDQDAFVALTGIDEQNILISCFASTQNVPKVIAKVNREELEDMAERIGLETIISPKHIVANILVQYARALENSMGSGVETLYKLMDDKVEALEFTVKPDAFKLVNVTLRDMKLKSNILIAGIIRDRKIIIPAGDDVLLPDDRVVVLAANQRLQDLSDILK